MTRRAPTLAVLALVLLLGSPAGAAEAKSATASGADGAAATVDTLATRAAIRTLRRGGNAVDAGVAAAGVLGVVEPFSSGIGGGGFMVVYRARDARVSTIDHREKAPVRMGPGSFMEGGKALRFSDARYSGMSVGVPGTVRGWDMALRRYGTQTLGDVLEPGVEVARRGFRIDQTFFDQAEENAASFDNVPSIRAPLPGP